MPITVAHKCTAFTTEIRWQIDNFLTVASIDNSKSNNPMLSESFNLYKSRLEFYLLFEPTNMQENGSKNHSALYLMPVDLDNEESVKLNYTFWIENTDGRRIGNQKKIEYTFKSKPLSGWGISEFVAHSDLYPPTDFVKNDRLFICCNIYMSKDQTIFKPFEIGENDKFLERFYDQDKQTNGCIVQIDEEKITASKQLLIDHSDFFKQMFNTNMKEKKSGIVKLEDITPEAFNAFISFVYSGYLNSDAIEHVEDLFTFADKFMIKKLKNKCVEIFLKVPAKKNILSRFALAVTYNLENVKEHLLTHLMDKNSECNCKNVFLSKEMDELRENNKQLADDIMAIILDKSLNNV